MMVGRIEFRMVEQSCPKAVSLMDCPNIFIEVTNRNC